MNKELPQRQRIPDEQTPIKLPAVEPGNWDLETLPQNDNLINPGNLDDVLAHQLKLVVKVACLHILNKAMPVFFETLKVYAERPYLHQVYDMVCLLMIWCIIITHDCGKAGKYAHYDAQAAFEGNAIIGHTHRLGYAVVGNADGKPHVGAMLGWLGDVEQVDYMHRIRALRDWAHGFGVGYMMPDGCVHVVPVPIINNTVIIEGKIIR